MNTVYNLTETKDKKLPKPDWIRVKAPQSKEYHETHELMRRLKLNTVCEEAACPNIGECWSKKHATVMILGSVCTRACAFCNVKTGKPDLLDPHEPDHLAEAVGKLGLEHVVITSVDRDDLPDGGAEHFAQCITKIRQSSPKTTIEVLTPDFLKKNGAEAIVVKARPDVYNHNVETVPRLYKTIRPGARYFNSLHLLKTVKELAQQFQDSSPLEGEQAHVRRSLGEGGSASDNEARAVGGKTPPASTSVADASSSQPPSLKGRAVPPLFTKSGLMVGLGEAKDEVLQVMDDMRAAEVDFITIGQYLQPTPAHAPVDRYVTPDEFEYYARMAKSKGFLMVSASPLTRSSYHAGEDFATMRAARAAKA